MNQYSFRIMSPQQASGAEEVQLVNQVYALWKKTFSSVLEAKGGKIDPDDFFRQHYIFLLQENDQIIGFDLATTFNIEIQNHLDHHYIRGLTDGAIKTIRSKNIQSILSLEYATILPAWRKHQSNIIWAEVLVALGLLFNDHYQVADAMVGTPRVDIKMDDVVKSVGFSTIIDTVFKMDYPCSVILETKKEKRKFNTLLTHKMAHELWKNHTYFAANTQTKKIKAA